MKLYIFVMALWVNGQLVEPPYKEQMPNLYECQTKAIDALNSYEPVNEAFVFSAGCTVVSPKTDPS
jgi:hypothetical protein